MKTAADILREQARAQAHAVNGEQPKAAPPPESPPWPEPIPLNEVPPAPDFPLAALPSELRRVVDEGSRAVNCPPDFFAVPMLAMAGGAVGNSRHVSVTRSHTQPPILFAAVVGPPGDGKSPALKILRRPFDHIQGDHLDAWRSRMAEWDEAEKEDRGPRPRLHRVIVSDITAESLGVVLTESPRGVVMVRDELAALVTGLNQYKAGGKGSDRQFYLALWAGDTITIDRKSDKERRGAPLYVSDPFCGIVGGLQPGVLSLLREKADDGFTDRFLFAYPSSVPARGERWLEMSDEATTAWALAVSKLLQLDMEAEAGRQRPFFVQLSGPARETWQQFTEAHAAEVNADDFPPFLAGPWSKLRGYCARLALTVHLLWAVMGEGPQTDRVSGQAMRLAADLVAYFKGHARKAYAVMDADEKVADARRVVKWITANGLRSFTKRDAYHGLKGTFPTVEALDPLLDLLQRQALIRLVPLPPRDGPGRPASPLYETNPRLVEQRHNPHNPQKPNSGDCGDTGGAPEGGTS